MIVIEIDASKNLVLAIASLVFGRTRRISW